LAAVQRSGLQHVRLHRFRHGQGVKEAAQAGDRQTSLAELVVGAFAVNGEGASAVSDRGAFSFSVAAALRGGSGIDSGD
jgi:hypothetical protein